MFTVRTFDSNGPYFPPTQGVYQASSLRDIIFHVRQAMEDGEYQIGVFDSDGKCKGMWTDEAEAIPDGEGGMTMEERSYALYRPGHMPAGIWNMHISKFKRV
jgi:hypothetical protein